MYQPDDAEWEYFLAAVADDPRAGLELPAPDPVGEWQAWWQAQTASPLAALAAVQGFVLPSATLTGITTRSKCRTAMRRGHWTPAGRGAIAPLDIRGPDRHVQRRRQHALLSAAAALRRADHVVSGRSAAILDGLPTMRVPTEPELTLAGSLDLGVRSAAHVFGAALDAEMCDTWFGVPVTDVDRTLVDLARHSRRDAIMAADAALRAGLTTPERLCRALDHATGWPGVRQARDVLALADGRAESPLESITRLALHDDGFPKPEPQVCIAGFRVDLLLPDVRLVIEADGRGKYRGNGAAADDALWREKEREGALRRADHHVERVVWSDIVGGWDRTSRRLWAAYHDLRRLSPSRAVWSGSIAKT